MRTSVPSYLFQLFLFSYGERSVPGAGETASQTVAKITSDLRQSCEGGVIGILNARRGTARARCIFRGTLSRQVRHISNLTPAAYVGPPDSAASEIRAPFIAPAAASIHP